MATQTASDLALRFMQAGRSRGARLGLLSAAVGIACAAAACGGNHGNTQAGGTGGGSGASPTTSASTGPGGVTSLSSSSSGSPWCAGQGSGGSCGSSSSSSGSTAALVFAIDLCEGPASQYDPPAAPRAVSDYVYGINAGAFVATPTKFGMIRQGGDDNSAYNWTNDYSNSGADYCYYQGASTKNGNLAGRYTDPTGDTIPAALAKGEAFLATVPILDYVAAAYGRNTGWDTATNMGDACPGPDPACPSRSGSVARQRGRRVPGRPGLRRARLTFAYANDGTATPTGQPGVLPNVMSKGSAFCSCPAGTTKCAGCTVGTSPVAQDEFVNFLKVNYASGGAPVFFDLDNEPNYWVGTHPELYPNNVQQGERAVGRRRRSATSRPRRPSRRRGPPRRCSAPSCRATAWRTAATTVAPTSSRGRRSSPTGTCSRWPRRRSSAGSQLLDVFDVHYYTVGSTDAECLEAPRLFWDPDATDISAAETNSLRLQLRGPQLLGHVLVSPRRHPPPAQEDRRRLRGEGDRPAGALLLASTTPGARRPSAAASPRPTCSASSGARASSPRRRGPSRRRPATTSRRRTPSTANYDGAGSVVGDTAVRATTTDTKNTSVYAFTHSDDVTSVEVVAINKQATAETVTVQIASSPAFQTATLYNLVPGKPRRGRRDGQRPAVTCASGACTPHAHHARDERHDNRPALT